MDTDAPVQEYALVGDLDRFFRSVYEYYIENGTACFIVNRILLLLRILFVILLTSFLIFWVDWAALQRCDIQFMSHRCAFRDAVRDSPLTSFSVWSAICLIFEVVFFGYFIVQAAATTRQIYALFPIRTTFSDLRIPDQVLPTTAWDTIAHAVTRIQAIKRISVVGVQDQLAIAQRVLRAENALVALVERDILPLTHTTTSATFIMYLRWVMADCLAQKKPPSADRVKRSLFTYGAAALVLAPFMFVYRLVVLVFRYAAELRSSVSGSSMLSRTFSELAMWKIRFANEYDHVFAARLAQCGSVASRYVAQFPTPLLSVAARHVLFMVGGLAAVIIVLSIRHYQALLYVTVGEQNLLWWLSMLLVAFTVLLPFATSGGSGSVVGSREVAAEVCTRCHGGGAPAWLLPAVFHPDCLLEEFCVVSGVGMETLVSGAAHSPETLAIVQDMYPYKAVQLLRELAGVLIAPWLLLWVLPQQAAPLAAFLRDDVVHVGGVGYIASLATFDLHAYGARDTKLCIEEGAEEGLPKGEGKKGGKEGAEEKKSGKRKRSSSPGTKGREGTAAAAGASRSAPGGERGGGSRGDVRAEGGFVAVGAAADMASGGEGAARRFTSGKLERSVAGFVVVHPSWAPAESLGVSEFVVALHSVIAHDLAEGGEGGGGGDGAIAQTLGTSVNGVGGGASVPVGFALGSPLGAGGVPLAGSLQGAGDGYDDTDPQRGPVVYGQRPRGGGLLSRAAHAISQSGRRGGYSSVPSPTDQDSHEGGSGGHGPDSASAAQLNLNLSGSQLGSTIGFPSVWDQLRSSHYGSAGTLSQGGGRGRGGGGGDVSRTSSAARLGGDADPLPVPREGGARRVGAGVRGARLSIRSEPAAQDRVMRIVDRVRGGMNGDGRDAGCVGSLFRERVFALYVSSSSPGWCSFSQRSL